MGSFYVNIVAIVLFKKGERRKRKEGKRDRDAQ